DKYHRDADGYFWYAGRTDDMIKAGGMWVSPAEVESALAEHPAVVEAGVVGAEDKDELVKPLAFVVLARGPSASPTLEAELKAFVKEQTKPRVLHHEQQDVVQRVRPRRDPESACEIQAREEQSRDHPERERIELPAVAVGAEVMKRREDRGAGEGRRDAGGKGAPAEQGPRGGGERAHEQHPEQQLLVDPRPQ